MFEILIFLVFLLAYFLAPLAWMWKMSTQFSDDMINRGRTAMLDDDFMDEAMERAYDRMVKESTEVPILVGGSGCLSLIWHWVAWPLYFSRLQREYMEYLHYLADELSPWNR